MQHCGNSHPKFLIKASNMWGCQPCYGVQEFLDIDVFFQFHGQGDVIFACEVRLLRLTGHYCLFISLPTIDHCCPCQPKWLVASTRSGSGHRSHAVMVHSVQKIHRSILLAVINIVYVVCWGVTLLTVCHFSPALCVCAMTHFNVASCVCVMWHACKVSFWPTYRVWRLNILP